MTVDSLAGQRGIFGPCAKRIQSEPRSGGRS